MPSFWKLRIETQGMTCTVCYAPLFPTAAFFFNGRIAFFFSSVLWCHSHFQLLLEKTHLRFIRRVWWWGVNSGRCRFFFFFGCLFIGHPDTSRMSAFSLRTWSTFFFSFSFLSFFFFRFRCFYLCLYFLNSLLIFPVPLSFFLPFSTDIHLI